MQDLTLAGTVGKDAVLRNTQGSDPVLNFPIAVNNGKDRDGNEIPASWFDCSIWGKRAEAVARFITKGTKITVRGKPTVRVHEGKAYMGCKVFEFTLQGGGQRSDERSAPPASSGQSRGAGSPDPYAGGGMDDDIPFNFEWRI
jgi:single-strand DNA-binding protein